MFPAYAPPDTLRTAVSQAAIVDCHIDAAERDLELTLYSEEYIPAKLLRLMEGELAKIYDLKSIALTATHPACEMQKVSPEEITALFIAADSRNRGSLAKARFSWSDNALTVHLAGNGKALLESSSAAVRRELASRFSVAPEISFVSGEELSGQELFDAMERMRQDAISTMPVAPLSKTLASAPPSDAIYGRSFKGTATPMKELSLDMGTVIVEGRIFSVENKELTKRNAWIINFDMTDHTGSIRVNKFMEAGEAKKILDRLTVGAVLRIRGKMDVNKFDGETVLRPYDIAPGFMPAREDLSHGEKRVELHLHTVMSNMDALTDTAAAVKQAAAWGHKAIAITDHGVAQSFPDAMKAAEKAKVAGTDEKIKILYGVEGYFINDVDDRIAVHGTQELDLADGEYVAFDLETTGLSSRNDTIIEIGAVRMCRGKELARFQTFVAPGRMLEKRITELTGITDEMLLGAPPIEEVLPKFLEFVGSRVLVAHNSDFDTGFVRAACERQGLAYALTSADTLILAQNLMPELH